MKKYDVDDDTRKKDDTRKNIIFMILKMVLRTILKIILKILILIIKKVRF